MGGIVGAAGGSHTHTYHLASTLATFSNGEAVGLVDTSAHPLLAQELEGAGWVRTEMPIFASMADAELAAAGLGEGGGEEEEDGEGEGENGVHPPSRPLHALMGLSPYCTRCRARVGVWAQVAPRGHRCTSHPHWRGTERSSWAMANPSRASRRYSPQVSARAGIRTGLLARPHFTRLTFLLTHALPPPMRTQWRQM